MSRKMLVLVGVLAVAVVASGCSKKESGSGGQATGGGLATSPPVATSPAAETPSPTVISSGGTTVNIGSAQIPDGFPSEFPIPDGAAPVNSVAAPDSYALWFTSSQSLEDLRSFFDEQLPANGWKVESKADFSDSSGTATVYTISGNGWSGGLYLGEGAAANMGFSGDFAFFVSLTKAGPSP